MPLIVSKVVSGGQTGVDRAGLDAAIFYEIQHGGWCPKGRRAEDGRIPDAYQLLETGSRNYAIRTKQNVIDSDGTLILYEQIMSRGTELTAKFARQQKRPLKKVDIQSLQHWADHELDSEVSAVLNWIETENINVLNIAGPRESTRPGIGGTARSFLLKLFDPANDSRFPR